MRSGIIVRLRIFFAGESNFGARNRLLDVRTVRVMGGGKVMARDDHEGYAGKPSHQMLYSLSVPEGSRSNNEYYVNLEVNGNGGTDSSGYIELIAED